MGKGTRQRSSIASDVSLKSKATVKSQASKVSAQDEAQGYEIVDNDYNYDSQKSRCSERYAEEEKIFQDVLDIDIVCEESDIRSGRWISILNDGVFKNDGETNGNSNGETNGNGESNGNGRDAKAEIQKEE